LRLWNLRVNDAGTTTDSLTTSDLVRDVAARLGWDPSGVRSSGLDVMPLDISGGSWSDAALDYAATLDDWFWRVLENRGQGPFLEYGPWEREWVVYLQAGNTADLTPTEIFNRVLVWWTDDAGAAHSVEQVASPDPLAAFGITNTFEYELPDGRNASTLADTVASTLLSRLSQARWQGTVDVQVVASGPSRDPWGILPGDLLTIADWKGDRLTGRVVSVDLRSSGVTVGLEQPASVASLVGRAALGAAPLMRGARVIRRAAVRRNPVPSVTRGGATRFFGPFGPR
jgi:hypothetical protein